MIVGVFLLAVGVGVGALIERSGASKTPGVKVVTVYGGSSASLPASAADTKGISGKRYEEQSESLPDVIETR